MYREQGRREPNKTRNTYVLPRQIVGREEAAHKPDVHLKHRDLRVLKERESSAFTLHFKTFRNSDTICLTKTTHSFGPKSSKNILEAR